MVSNGSSGPPGGNNSSPANNVHAGSISMSMPLGGLQSPSSTSSTSTTVYNVQSSYSNHHHHPHPQQHQNRSHHLFQVSSSMSMSGSAGPSTTNHNPSNNVFNMNQLSSQVQQQQPQSQQNVAQQTNSNNNGNGGSGPNSEMELPTLSQLSQADLNGLVSLEDEDDDDLFKQLGETNFELDSILDGFVDENNHPITHHQPPSTSMQYNLPTFHPPHPHIHPNSSPQLLHHPHHMNYGNNCPSNDDRLGKRRRKIKATETQLQAGQGGLLSLASHSHPNNGSNGPMGPNRKTSSSSILQTQLCQPSQSDNGIRIGPRGKANIASSNPLLAGKILQRNIVYFRTHSSTDEFIIQIL